MWGREGKLEGEKNQEKKSKALSWGARGDNNDRDLNHSSERKIITKKREKGWGTK